MDYHELVGMVISLPQKSELQKTIEEIEKLEYRKEMGLSLLNNNYTAPRRPRGRPTSVTTEVIRDLRTSFLMGCSDKEACAYAGIHPSIYYAYKDRNPEFQEYVEAWKEEPILKAKAAIYRTLDIPEHAKWYLERKLRHEFALRKELTGADGGAIGLALDRLESDYGAIADRAKASLGPSITGQVVEDDPSLQNKG